MPVTWQTRDQRVFIEDHVPSYIQHSTNGTDKKEFWPDFLSNWFERWPVQEPAPELVEKEGEEKALKIERGKQVGRLKRVFRTAVDDKAIGGKKKLHLEDPPPRKRSEVQVYMSLYYDTRIREAVQKRWAETEIANMDFSRGDIPEDQIDPADSSLLKDTKIPLFFKNLVAQGLYETEEESIKQIVRSTREEESLVKTVHNTSEEEQLELVREYQRNMSSLRRSLSNILRNAEKKCGAKGIIWLACPSPSAGGMPVGNLQCIGTTPQGEDFEAYLGETKAKDVKGHFTDWSYEIYPPSDWHLYTLDTPVDANQLADVDMDQPAGVGTNQPAGVDNDEVPPLEPITSFPSCSHSQPATDGLPCEQDSCPPPPSSQQIVSGSGATISMTVALPVMTDEPMWMKKKKTIEYFRAAFKLGKLEDLVWRWYKLERLLGFPEMTPPGFKITKRPGVVPVFFKNGHNYKKDYGLDASILGPQIMAWWAEICSEGETLGVRYGGPTGIYSLIVLMSWWCALLKEEPEHKHIDLLLTLANIDVVLQLTINEIVSNTGTTSSSPRSSPTSPSLSSSSPTPPSSSQRRKRVDVATSSPRKRLRSG